MNTGYKKILLGKQRKQQTTWQPIWCVCLSSKLWNRFQPRCVKLQLSSSEAQGTCHYQIIVCSDSRNYTSKSPWKHTCCQNTNHCYPIQLNAKFDCSTEQGLQAEMTQCFSGRLLTRVETKIFFFHFFKNTSVCSSELLSIGFSALQLYCTASVFPLAVTLPGSCEGFTTV